MELLSLPLNYSIEDYYKECHALQNKLDPPINYKQRKLAQKQYFCEICGVEIHKHENYWRYKANPSYSKKLGHNKYFPWRIRCDEHEPKHHSELDYIKEE